MKQQLNKLFSLFFTIMWFLHLGEPEIAYATATPLPVPVSRFFTNSGAPCAGCQVFTYQAGTTTPQASYSDSTGTVQNPNPVILDSNGYAPIWISGAYKIVLEDASNNIIWTADQIQDFFTFNNITSTSTSSVAVSNNSNVTFTTQSGKYFSPGIYLQVVETSAPTTNWMHGQVVSYSGTTLTIAMDKSAGSGTYADWTISLSGPAGPQGIQGASGAGSGDMIGADNLAVGAGGVANAATARTNLGLGSAATLNAGTSANQVVQLNGSSQLPAVSGALLTNVAGVPVVTNSSSGTIVFGAVTVEWGTASNNSTVTFPTAFSNTPYNVELTPIATSSGSCTTCNTIPVFAKSVTSSSFTPVFGSSTGYWFAIGPT